MVPPLPNPHPLLLLLSPRRLLHAFTPLLIGSLALADAITGRVVDSHGVGVAGVDIDIKNLGGGGTPPIINDGTDANGFFTSTLPAGVYAVTFNAPPPPLSTHLTVVIDNVVVVGTKNMGTIALPPGVSVKGKAVNPANAPVAGVNIDVIDQVTGNKLINKSGTTDAFGIFWVAAPANAIELDLKTAGVVGQTLAPLGLALSPTANIDLGLIHLKAGFHLMGTVKRSNGSAVSGANIDVVDVPTNTTLFTPNDNTTSTGTFDVVVPSGTYDVEACPPASQLLVGVDINSLIVNGAKSVGVMTMVNGVRLSGTVRNRRGALQPGADVNAYVVATGHSIFLCGDNANASGAYSVIVPTGLLDIVFSPPGPHFPWEKDRHLGVNVTGTTTLNGNLPGLPRGGLSNGAPAPTGDTFLPLTATPTARTYGPGLPGSAGSVPGIGTSGRVPSARQSDFASDFAIRVTGGRGGAPALLLLGQHEAVTPLLGGLLLVTPSARFSVRLGGPSGVAGAGSGSFSLPVTDPGLIGQTLYAQVLILDAGAPYGYSMTRGLRLTIGP